MVLVCRQTRATLKEDQLVTEAVRKSIYTATPWGVGSLKQVLGMDQSLFGKLEYASTGTDLVILLFLLTLRLYDYNIEDRE